MTFFTWGIHGWIVYTLVALLVAFIAYRKGLPMTMPWFWSNDTQHWTQSDERQN